MSLYQKASLVQIPSGYKASSANLYSVVPNSGDGDFTVSVAANATRVNKDGLIESVAANQARLNYDPTNPQDPHLLLEPTRRNLIGRSEEFNLWGDTGVTVTPNATIAPTGAQTADLLTSTANNWRRNFVYGVSNGTVYSFSCFVKKHTTTDFVQFEIYRGASASNLDFQFSTENLIASDANLTNLKVENYPNDWYRLSCNFTANGTTGIIYAYPSVNYGVAGSAYFWGAQVEDNASGGDADYATSYIPTSGSTVTRTQDSCLNGGTTSEFNDSEGVLFIESQALANDLSYRFISICDGTTNNRVLISHNTVSNQIRADVIVSGSTQATMTTNSYTITDNHKIAIKYKTNDFALWVDGTEVSTDTSGNTFPSGTLSEINFDNGTLGASFYYEGKLKQLIYFNEALTDAELITLTS